MDRKKKIMLIVPMLHQGGFERVCVATARLLEPYYEVYIVIFDSRDIAYDIKGLNVTDLHMGVKDSMAGKAVNLVRRCLAVRRLKRKLKIDIAYSFGPTANMVNVFSGRAMELSTELSTEIWVGIRSYMDMENERKIRLFTGRADKVLCCSRRIEEEIEEKYHCSKAVTLYNPLDVAELKRRAGEEEPELPWDSREHIIVSMGREDDVKGFWHLMKAFAWMRKEVPDAKLMIIGEGDFEEYRMLAEGLGVGDKVYFTGMKKNPFPYLKTASLYVLTSYHEGFPNALIEAMAFGIPVIATDCLTGPREILLGDGEEYGILTANMSPEKNMDASLITEEERLLADEMERMLKEEEYHEKYSRAAVKRADDFSNEFYTECIRGWIETDSNSEGD